MPNSDPQDARPQGGTPSAPRPRRVLIADDSDAFRAALAELLAAMPGFEVVGGARNGREAVALADSLQPDLLLLDFQMPEGNGLEVLRRLRATPSAVRVVMVSLHDTEPVRALCLRHGADGFVSKHRLRAQLAPLLAACDFTLSSITQPTSPSA